MESKGLEINQAKATFLQNEDFFPNLSEQLGPRRLYDRTSKVV